MPPRVVKPLEWVGASRRDLQGFPGSVRDVMGYALYVAQQGGMHLDAKSLKGLGPRVLEIVSGHESGTYRAVYTARFARAVYVLHAFQKKSKRGIATPLREIELVKARMKLAEAHYAATYAEEPRDG